MMNFFDHVYKILIKNLKKNVEQVFEKMLNVYTKNVDHILKK